MKRVKITVTKFVPERLDGKPVDWNSRGEWDGAICDGVSNRNSKGQCGAYVMNCEGWRCAKCLADPRNADALQVWLEG